MKSLLGFPIMNDEDTLSAELKHSAEAPIGFTISKSRAKRDPGIDLLCNAACAPSVLLVQVTFDN